MPDAIEILDHIHILFNALEAALEGLPWFGEFKESLSASCLFFGDRKHIDRFVEVCQIPAGIAKGIRRLPHHLISWRWEVLEDIALGIIDMWPFFAILRPC